MIIQTIAIIVPIIIAIIQAAPNFLFRERYFNYPYCDYLNPHAERIVVLGQRIWKLMLLFIMALWVLIAIMDYFNQHTSFAYLIVVFFSMIGSSVIKDIFHNVIVFKWKFINPFYKFIERITPDIICIFLITVLLLCGLIITFHFTIKFQSIMAVIVEIIIILEGVFCVSRIIADTTELYYLHGVESLSVLTTDGTEYTDIKAFKDNKKSIKICKDNKVIYIEKRNIVTIEKEMEAQPILYTVLKSIISKKNNSND